MRDNNRNKRKLKILTILNYSTKTLSAKEIHKQSYPIGLSIEAIRSRLLSYIRQGIIKRKRENNRFVYSITLRGVDRLNYFLNLKEQIDLLVREPVRHLFKREAIRL